MENKSQTLEEESNNFRGGAEASTLRRSAPCAPAPGEQPEPGYTEGSNVNWKQSLATGGPSFERPWEHPGYNQEEQHSPYWETRGINSKRCRGKSKKGKERV